MGMVSYIEALHIYVYAIKLWMEPEYLIVLHILIIFIFCQKTNQTL